MMYGYTLLVPMNQSVPTKSEFPLHNRRMKFFKNGCNGGRWEIFAKNWGEPEIVVVGGGGGELKKKNKLKYIFLKIVATLSS